MNLMLQFLGRNGKRKRSSPIYPGTYRAPECTVSELDYDNVPKRHNNVKPCGKVITVEAPKFAVSSLQITLSQEQFRCQSQKKESTILNPNPTPQKQRRISLVFSPDHARNCVFSIDKEEHDSVDGETESTCLEFHLEELPNDTSKITPNEGIRHTRTCSICMEIHSKCNHHRNKVFPLPDQFQSRESFHEENTSFRKIWEKLPSFCEKRNKDHKHGPATGVRKCYITSLLEALLKGRNCCTTYAIGGDTSAKTEKKQKVTFKSLSKKGVTLFNDRAGEKDRSKKSPLHKERNITVDYKSEAMDECQNCFDSLKNQQSTCLIGGKMCYGNQQSRGSIDGMDECQNCNCSSLKNQQSNCSIGRKMCYVNQQSRGSIDCMDECQNWSSLKNPQSKCSTGGKIYYGNQQSSGSIDGNMDECQNWTSLKNQQSKCTIGEKLCYGNQQSRGSIDGMEECHNWSSLKNRQSKCSIDGKICCGNKQSRRSLDGMEECQNWSSIKNQRSKCSIGTKMCYGNEQSRVSIDGIDECRNLSPLKKQQSKCSSSTKICYGNQQPRGSIDGMDGCQNWSSLKNQQCKCSIDGKTCCGNQQSRVSIDRMHECQNWSSLRNQQSKCSMSGKLCYGNQQSRGSIDRRMGYEIQQSQGSIDHGSQEQWINTDSDYVELVLE